MKTCPFCGAEGELKYDRWIYANHLDWCVIEKEEAVDIDVWNNRSGDDIIEWIIKNVTTNVVPGDEGNEEALVYNLVHLAAYGSGFRYYDYEPEQDAEIKSLYKKYGREYME